MHIIIKYYLRNMREKKFRTLLILLSVMLSAALFFASSAISGTIESMYLQRMKKYFGTTDIVIHANEKSPSSFFHIKQAERIKTLNYIIGAVESRASYKSKQESVDIDLKGFELQELQKMNPYVLGSQERLQPFTGKKIIIGKAIAEKFNLKPGNHIDLMLGDNRYRFRICGIAEPVGVFQEDGRSNTSVVPKKTLAALLNATGQVSVIYIQLQDRTQLQYSIEKLSKIYRRYTVRESISKEELQQYINIISTPLMLMVILVLLMSVFIIYTSFKVITKERLPVIGTFRSIGATKKTTDQVLFAESIFYGVVGGILGCILGIEILYVMSILMAPEWLAGKLNTTIEFTPFHLILSFILAIILALVSAFAPILKISRIPVKDIILNSIDKAKQQKNRNLVLGLLFLFIAYCAPVIVPKSIIFIVTGACMVLSIVAIILMIPFITNWFIDGLERIYFYIFANEGILAAKNLRGNKSILNNISLLAIGISSLLMINTLSYSVGKEVVNVYRDCKFDIWMGTGQADRSFKGRLFSVPGVKNVYGLYSAYNIEIAGQKDKIMWFTSAQFPEYIKFWDVHMEGDQRAIFKDFNNSRNILLSSMLRDKLGVVKGEFITFKTKRGDRAYKISGFFNSLMENGNYSIIPERYLKSDMIEQYYSDIFIQTSQDPKVVEGRLRKKFNRNHPFIMTMRDMEKRNMQSNAQMFFILQGFSVLALIIGIFGVFNNLIISFIERKRALAIMQSVGMSMFQSIKMLFIESLTGGIIGGAVGIMSGLLLISLVPHVMKSLNLPVPMHYSGIQFLFSFLAGVVIMVIASVSPIFKSAKLKMIEAIKYE